MGEGYNALKFNGTNAYLDITPQQLIESNEDFTISIHVVDSVFNPIQVPFFDTSYFHYSWQSPSHPSFSLSIFNNDPYWSGGSVGNSIYFLGYPNIDDKNYGDYPFHFDNIGSLTSYHIALIRKDNIIKAALNGTFLPESYTYSSQLYSSDKIVVGAYSGVVGEGEIPSHYSASTYDDICIIKGKALWTENFTPPTTYLPDKI